MATEGTFVLADIGGYTQFLTGVGIEHGKEITSHLFNSLLKCNRGRWKVANIEGDCIFFYREGREPAADLLEHIRTLYGDFCDRCVDITSRSSCTCGACSRTGDLTLKFIVHGGEFDTQKIGNREELIGPDVVLAHRLLKNSVGTKEYALLTSAYLDGQSAGVASVGGADEYEDVGSVDYGVTDLAPMRAEMAEKRRFFVTAEDAKLKVVEEINAPPEVIFDALIDLDKRRKWQTTIKEMTHVAGESGKVGEFHRCVHEDGSKIVHYTVAIDEEGHRNTERIWFSSLAKDAYITSGAEPSGVGCSRAYFYATFEAGMPVIGHVMLPII